LLYSFLFRWLWIRANSKKVGSIRYLVEFLGLGIGLSHGVYKLSKANWRYTRTRFYFWSRTLTRGSSVRAAVHLDDWTQPLRSTDRRSRVMKFVPFSEESSGLMSWLFLAELLVASLLCCLSNPNNKHVNSDSVAEMTAVIFPKSGHRIPEHLAELCRGKTRDLFRRTFILKLDSLTWLLEVIFPSIFKRMQVWQIQGYYDRLISNSKFTNTFLWYRVWAGSL
jgi:hypothetical protein